MSAQMIFIPLTPHISEEESQQPQGDENKGSSAAGGGTGGSTARGGSAGASGGRVPKYPPFEPLPLGKTIKVFGQNPNHLGEFDSIVSMFRSLHAAGMSEKLPGGSNTVFATVKDLSELEKPSLHHELSRLPSGLTIVVGPKSLSSKLT